MEQFATVGMEPPVKTGESPTAYVPVGAPLTNGGTTEMIQQGGS